MKNIKALLLPVLILPLLLSGCKDDDPYVAPATEGVKFIFEHRETATRLLTESVSLDDVRTVKFYLRNSSGEEVEIPSLVLYGNSELKETETVLLSPDIYTVERYTVYNQKSAELLTEEPGRNNEFTVSAGNITDYKLDFVTKTLYDTNYIKNGLKAICVEVFGEDTSLWPEEWDFSMEIKDWYDVQDWPYLLFTVTQDVIEWFSGFDFHGPQWDVMEKLPESLTYFSTVDVVQVRDIPNFRYLSDNLTDLTWLCFICIRNTAFEQFPDYMLDPNINWTIGNVSSQYGFEIFIRDCPNFTEIPEGIVTFKNMTSLRLNNNGLTSIDVPLHKLEKLDYVDFTGNKQLTSIGDGVFGPDSNVSVMRFDSMPGLRLPSNLNLMPNLRTISMQHCGLTSVPSEFRGCGKIDMLHLNDNNLTSIGESDLQGLVSLADLVLNNNTGLTASNIRLVSDTLTTVQLSGCGLNALPSLDRLPKLRGLYLEDNSFTQLASLDFTANPLLRVLSLNGNKSLTSLPADFTFADTAPGEFPEYFRYLMLKGCSSLNWTAPAAWDAVTYGVVNGESVEELYTIIPPARPYNEFTAEVESHVHIDIRNTTSITVN